MDLRIGEHLRGGGRYRCRPKPWTDLRPTVRVIPLPYWKWLLRSVETLLILILWPVYNQQKNRWNPRRIPIRTAILQREVRDRIGWCFNLRPGHVFLWIFLLALIINWEGR